MQHVVRVVLDAVARVPETGQENEGSDHPGVFGGPAPFNLPGERYPHQDHDEGDGNENVENNRYRQSRENDDHRVCVSGS